MKALGILLLGTTLAGGSVIAGELEPPGPPAPTMKSLDEVPPTRSQILDSTDGEPGGCNSTRFQCVMGGEAVLDLETGLVWQRTPSTIVVSSWIAAIDQCRSETTGNRLGWELPVFSDLMTLADPSQSGPALPPGHPFVLSAQTAFWSSTTDHSQTDLAWLMTVADGSPFFTTKSDDYYRWCVRGSVSSSFTSQPNVPPAGSASSSRE